MASPLQADVVIVGSGVAGALAAARLARSGLQVLILEAGKPVDRSQAVQNFWNAAIKVPECAYPIQPEATHPTTDRPGDWYQQEGPDFFKSTYLKVVGGTTWHWLGTCLRLLPSDFQLQTLHGRGVDWPIVYSDLEPYYLQAEHALGVSGDSDHDLGSPRSGAFLLPPIPQSYLDRTLTQALKDTRFQVQATPQARNSVVHDQRPPCCGSSSCIPVCPVQAKYDATVHLKQAQAAGARLLDQSTVVQLVPDAQGRIRSARFRRWDQSEGEVQAPIFVLACHAIETPRLLLASKSEAWPRGLANRSDQVGRNLMDHPVQLSWALSHDPVYPYRGPLSTSGIENLRDGGFRGDRSAYRIEIGNDGWNWPTGAPLTLAAQMAGRGLSAADLDRALAHETSRHLRLTALTEQLPEADNRVTLDATKTDYYGVPLPHIHYRVGDYARQGMQQARQDHGEIFGQLQASAIQHATDFFGAGHIMGTCRMGSDPDHSVVDAQLRSHDHQNLFILGSSVFPTGGTANPSLTIAALSLRAAEAIEKQFRAQQ
ncbi:GMC family oxidoreductase [Castellaniella sp.]|uniref:GMC family oxidoreductase n=1 Tax=Castellaniella sp. TaxID=1955812 RepID=UPI002AFE19C0|nr:GMC family oxidoreductase [Castellaniella sp.]